MEKVWERIKTLADLVRQPTIEELLKIERKYNSKEEVLFRQEAAYLDLNLSDDARKLIDELMELRVDIDSNFNCLSYIAGLIDCYTFLLERGLLSDA